MSVGEYLAFLSLKYEVDPDELYNSLVTAVEKGKAKCGELLIENRGKQKDKTIILITKNSKVVTQFPVHKDFFSEVNPIKNVDRERLPRRRLISKKNKGKSFFRIRDLQVGMRQVNLRARVLEVANPTLVLTRFGNYASVANALIEDETGVIKLCLWNDQINSISVGDHVEVKNAHVSIFRGERQLRIGRNGKIAMADENVELPVEKLKEA